MEQATNQAQIAVWFERLIPLLAVQKLPCENGPARFADVHEFMLMQYDNNCGRFKHSDQRNYIYVKRTISGFKLEIPISQEPFHLGFFDKFEFDPVAYQKALDEARQRREETQLDNRTNLILGKCDNG